MSPGPVLPRVGVSSCLLGEKVRYDGRDKLAPLLLELIGPHVEWIPVCPELEAGMGVPREPVRLERASCDDSSPRGPRMVGTVSGRDWTAAVETFARSRLISLARAGLSGYVLKSRSPSCGLAAALFAPQSVSPLPDLAVPGLFAAALRRVLPALPVIEETALSSRASCEEFLRRVTAYDLARAAVAGTGRGPAVSGTRCESSD